MSKKKYKRRSGRPRYSDVGANSLGYCFQQLELAGMRCGKTVLECLFKILGRVLVATPNGVTLRVRPLFKTKLVTGRKVLNALRRQGVLILKTEKKYNPRLKTSTARRWGPSRELLGHDCDRRRVRSYSDYIKGRIVHSKQSHGIVRIDEDWVPVNVVESLSIGTGCYFDTKGAFDIVDNQFDGDPDIILGFMKAVGRQDGELKPDWKQSPNGGRLYASSPSVQNIPRKVVPALGSVDGGKVIADIDYQSFELNILLALIGEEAVQDSIRVLAHETGLPRGSVKSVIVGVLHGQRRQHIQYNREYDPAVKELRLDRYDRVVSALGSLHPKLSKKIAELDKHELQTRASKVFVQALSAGLEVRGGEGSGIPLHDGWKTWVDDMPHAQEIANAFEAEAERLTGQKIPAVAEIVASGDSRFFPFRDD